ncbi:hypothetical protein JY96_12230 [Aquabacterium sp. NJ1]|uniref:hypothetical protein n=1 Tax=Aquabacterium sp. NJ1 TaxID=1538295 RepID=UPI00052C1A43|nr:hypothetical protein [Aquabacterium sp. NJ1]KGM40547.1 hypothetical protein JY96_12230 [Aquabacterium sp. NJ1]
MGTRSGLPGGRLSALVLGACLVGQTGQAAWAEGQGGLPQRNLLVEWRMGGQGQTQQRNQGIRTGQIIVDSRGGVVGRTSIGMETIQTESQTDTVQQVQVLNGGKARLFVGKSQPYTVWQWAWTGQGGGGLGVIGPQANNAGTNAGGATAGASGNTPAGGNGQAGNYPVNMVPQTVWIDLGQGLNVRPRWAGGHAPVIVELEAQARQPAQLGSQMGGVYGGQIDPDGQTRRIEVASTLSVPLGQWAVVARSGGRVQRQQSGSLSTRDLDDSQSEQLEIRITAP